MSKYFSPEREHRLLGFAERPGEFVPRPEDHARVEQNVRYLDLRFRSAISQLQRRHNVRFRTTGGRPGDTIEEPGVRLAGERGGALDRQRGSISARLEALRKRTFESRETFETERHQLLDEIEHLVDYARHQVDQRHLDQAEALVVEPERRRDGSTVYWVEGDWAVNTLTFSYITSQRGGRTTRRADSAIFNAPAVGEYVVPGLGAFHRGRHNGKKYFTFTPDAAFDGTVTFIYNGRSVTIDVHGAEPRRETVPPPAPPSAPFRLPPVRPRTLNEVERRTVTRTARDTFQLLSDRSDTLSRGVGDGEFKNGIDPALRIRFINLMRQYERAGLEAEEQQEFRALLDTFKRYEEALLRQEAERSNPYNFHRVRGGTVDGVGDEHYQHQYAITLPRSLANNLHVKFRNYHYRGDEYQGYLNCRSRVHSGVFTGYRFGRPTWAMVISRMNIGADRETIYIYAAGPHDIEDIRVNTGLVRPAPAARSIYTDTYLETAGRDMGRRATEATDRTSRERELEENIRKQEQGLKTTTELVEGLRGSLADSTGDRADNIRRRIDALLKSIEDIQKRMEQNRKDLQELRRGTR